MIHKDRIYQHLEILKDDIESQYDALDARGDVSWNCYNKNNWRTMLNNIIEIEKELDSMSVTVDDLEKLVNEINEVTNSPREYATEVNGGYRMNLGHYYLVNVSSGHQYQLQRVISYEGSSEAPLGIQVRTLDEMYRSLFDYLGELREEKNKTQKS